MKKIILTITLLLLSSFCFAETYYVKNGGNDSLAGTSDATAWETVSKVNNTSMAVGDDVYFKCGDTWDLTYRFDMDWNGTVVDRAIIGSYYMDGGVEILGVAGDKPVFDCNKVYPTGDWPDCRYGQVVQVYNREYVTFKNLRVVNSRGHGFNFAWGTSIEAIGLETDSTTSCGIQFYDIEGGLIEDCDVRESSQIYYEYPDHLWPDAINVCRYSNNITVRHCKVYESWGEGIGVYFYATNTIIENNIIYDTRSGKIYVANSKYVIIRNNIVYSTTNSTYWRWQGGVKFPSSGITLNDEPYESHIPFISYADVYNNFVAGCNWGISLATNSFVPEEDNFREGNVYNNTLVDNRTSIRTHNGPFTDCNIKNNVVWSITSTGEWPAQDCVCYYPDAANAITWSNNNWTTTAAYPYSGASDVIGAANLKKISGWRSIVNWDDLTYDDFSITATSPGIETGANLGGSWEDLLEAENINWSNDYFPSKDQDNYGTGWEMGADIYDVGGGPAPGVEKIYKGLFF